MRSLLSLALVAGCGRDIRIDCTTSVLTYDNFGEPFMLDWCRGCHSETVLQRQRAPADINFDTLDEVHAWSTKILTTAGPTDATMPPAGGPSPGERDMLAEWIRCGAP